MGRFPRALAALCLVTVLAGGAACGSPAGAERSFGDSELINDMASQLAAADATPYTAVYMLDDSTTVSISHEVDPSRTAYHFTGGMVLITTSGTTSCTTGAKPVCTVSVGATPGGDVPTGIDPLIERGGLIRPEMVITLLTQTALDSNALVSENDRTIAGDTATCVQISGVPEPETYSTCVTSSGLLGSFNGTAGTANIDVQLAQFSMTPDATQFILPKNAKTGH